MSQYLEHYLEMSERKRWTPLTFLRRTLTGEAARYTRRYHRALMADIERGVAAGKIVAVPSAKGGTAYVEVL